MRHTLVTVQSDAKRINLYNFPQQSFHFFFKQTEI